MVIVVGNPSQEEKGRRRGEDGGKTGGIGGNRGGGGPRFPQKELKKIQIKKKKNFKKQLSSHEKTNVFW